MDSLIAGDLKCLLAIVPDVDVGEMSLDPKTSKIWLISGKMLFLF